MPTLTIQEIAEGLQSDDPCAKFLAAQNANKILSETFSPINSFVNTGVVPNLVECLKCYNNVPLQFEACRALRHIVSGTTEETRAVVVAGSVPIFISLSSSHVNVAEEAVLALGNIIGDCPEFRDLVISHGAVPHLLSLLTPDISTEFRRNITWTLSNLCRDIKPDPPIELVKLCLPAFAVLICDSDPETVIDVCWAICYLTNGPNEKLQTVIEAGFVPMLVELLNKKEIAILKPAIRSVGNIFKGENSQTQAVIDAGALAPLKKLITHEDEDIVEEVCCAISNIISSNSNQIQAVIDHGLVENIINVLYHGSFTSRINAAKVVSNLTVRGTLDQIMYLVQADVIPSLFYLLFIRDSKILNVLLDAITNILNATVKVNAFEVACFYIELCNGFNELEKLLERKDEYEEEDEDVYASTCGIIKLASNLVGLENVLKDENEDVNVYEAACGAIKLALKSR